MCTSCVEGASVKTCFEWRHAQRSNWSPWSHSRGLSLLLPALLYPQVSHNPRPTPTMSSDVNEQLSQYLDSWKNETQNENIISVLSKYVPSSCFTDLSPVPNISLEFLILLKRRPRLISKWTLIHLTTDILVAQNLPALWVLCLRISSKMTIL